MRTRDKILSLIAFGLVVFFSLSILIGEIVSMAQGAFDSSDPLVWMKVIFSFLLSGAAIGFAAIGFLKILKDKVGPSLFFLPFILAFLLFMLAYCVPTIIHYFMVYSSLAGSPVAIVGYSIAFYGGIAELVLAILLLVLKVKPNIKFILMLAFFGLGVLICLVSFILSFVSGANKFDTLVIGAPFIVGTICALLIDFLGRKEKVEE